jgi:predicted flap endonuclease-1-like 5' DNA nuclease
MKISMGSSTPYRASATLFERTPGGPGTKTMTYPIADMAGIAPELRAKLREAGIRTTAKLLEGAKGLKERKELAKKVEIDPKILLQMANLADRMRIKGVGQEYAELLRAAGVDTVNELRYRNPAKLARKMAEANAARGLVRILPTEPMIERWIEHAKKLPLKISY